MDAIGIDLGSYKCVMGVVKKGGVDIVLNDGSNRSTPVQVAYTESERIIGDQVKNQIKKNFKNSILFLPRFCGLNAENKDQIALEERFTTQKVVSLENKKIGFEIVQMGTKHILSIEQVLSYYMTKMKAFYEKAEFKTKDVVITVPSYFTNVERQSVLDAADIAGFKCLRTLNESTSIALNYGFFRKRELDVKVNRKVVFVDFGHSKTTITIASFIQGKTKILCHNSDRNLGAREFDYTLYQKFSEEFNAKYGADPAKNVRCQIRMFEAIEKARKMLSSTPDTNINIEYLMNEEDFNRNLKRDEFEELIAPLLERFRKLLQDTLAMSGVKNDDIHSVEMVGDATRTPSILNIATEVTGKEPLRTLNALECVARGANLQSAMLSPQFSVSTFIVEDSNNLPVSITYKFNGEEKVITKELFPKGSLFPVTKSLTFDNKLGDMELLVHYTAGAPLLTGLPDHVAKYLIKEGKAKHSDAVGGSKVKFILKVSNNIHQIPCLEGVEFQEEWNEEEKVAIKKAVPAAPKKDAKPAAEGEAPVEEKKEEIKTEQDFEIKQRKKTTTSNIQFETQAHSLPPALKTQYIGLEAEMYKEDRRLLDWKEFRNDLETYSYDMRNNLDSYGTYEKHYEVNARTEFLKTVNETVEWLYAAGETASTQEYSDKLEAFRAVGEPIKMRYRYYSMVGEFFNIHEQVVSYIETTLPQIEHLTEKQKFTVNEKSALVKTFIDQVKAEFASKPQTEDPSFTLVDIENKIHLLKAECKAIFSTPAPKPKEEEVKDDCCTKDGGCTKEGAKEDATMWEDQPEGAKTEAPAADATDAPAAEGTEAAKDAEMKE